MRAVVVLVLDVCNANSASPQRSLSNKRPFLERVKTYLKDKGEVINVLKQGQDKAAEEAEKTMRQVRSLMGV